MCKRVSKSACRYSSIRFCSVLTIIALLQKFRLNDGFSLIKNLVLGSIIPGRLVLKSPIWGIGCFYPDKIKPLVSLCSRARKILTGWEIAKNEGSNPTERERFYSRLGKATLTGAQWIWFTGEGCYPERRSQRQLFPHRSARRDPDTGGMPRPF